MPFGVGLFGVGAMGGVALFGLNPGFLMLGRIGIMGKVGMGGSGFIYNGFDWYDLVV